MLNDRPIAQGNNFPTRQTFDSDTGKFWLQRDTDSAGVRRVTLINRSEEWFSDDDWPSDNPELVASFRTFAGAVNKAADFLEGKI